MINFFDSPFANNASAPKVFTPPQFNWKIQNFTTGNIYTIGTPLGDGAFSMVYHCTDSWGKKLAAKVFTPQNKSYDDIKKHWLEEIDKLIRLRHPNITYIYEAFEYLDTFYIITEYCEMPIEILYGAAGIDLNQWIPAFSKDVLHALSFIHRSNFVHKDLHAGNIFVAAATDSMVLKEPVWSFKIGDLGITNQPQLINPLNTKLANWMLPPEFYDPNEFGVLSHVTDIYHLGLLLLSFTQNRQLNFTEEQIRMGEPRQLAEGLQFPYAPVIAKALRRHSAYRYQSALEMWQDLERVLYPNYIFAPQGLPNFIPPQINL